MKTTDKIDLRGFQTKAKAVRWVCAEKGRMAFAPHEAIFITAHYVYVPKEHESLFTDGDAFTRLPDAVQEHYERDIVMFIHYSSEDDTGGCEQMIKTLLE